MEVQPRLLDQSAKVDVNRTSDTIPHCGSLFLVALDVPKSVRDVLEIETDTTFQQARSLPTPVAKKMAMGALTGLMTVRSAQRFLLRLSVQCRRKNQKANKVENQHSKHGEPPGRLREMF
jgi:hypothetical protein